MKKKAIFRLLFVLMLILLTLQYATAQAGRGKARLAGNVIDEEGNPIAAAKISLDLLGRETTSRDTSTNNKGEWIFMGLGSGNWRITVTAEGYIETFQDTFVSQIGRNPKVSITMKKIVETHSLADDLGLIEKAGGLFEERQFEEALALLLQFLENNPEAYMTRINIGDCYKEMGEYDKAEAEYNLALEAAQTDEKMGKEMMAKATAGKGDIYLKKGELEQAQELFEKSIELLPDNEILAYNVGEIYFSNRNLEEAITYYGIAIRIKPDWSLPYYRQGLVYLNKEDYSNAETNFRKFLEIDPGSELAGSVRGMLDYLEKIKR
jgi:tetratricopeptide (TPR) repeat protein